MQIDGRQERQLHKALLSAFPTREALEKMVRYGLHENLATIAGNGTLDDTVFRLVRWAVTNGRPEELVNAALGENCRNRQLRDVAQQFRLPVPNCIKEEIKKIPIWVKVGFGILVVGIIASFLIPVSCQSYQQYTQDQAQINQQNSLYQEYMQKPPSHSYDPTSSRLWSTDTTVNGQCILEANEDIQAKANSGKTFMACLTNPISAQNFAIQASISVTQGAAAGLVFGSTSADPNNPSYYAFIVCLQDSPACKSQQFALMHITNTGTQCLGPQSCTSTSNAVVTTAGQKNVLTVIIQQEQSAYVALLYINGSSVRQVSLSTSQSGQVGFLAYSAGNTNRDQTAIAYIDSFKVWE